VGRPFLVKVIRPKAARGRLTIAMLAAVSASPLDRAKVEPGNADLVKLFPGLWVQKLPQVVYAQLFAGGKPVGPALVLQPMLNPALAKPSADGKTIDFVPDSDHAYTGIRAWVDQDVVLDTTLGEMEFRMRPDAAPNTAWNFLELIKGGFYAGVIWHRVVAKRADGSPFVIQAGDPTGTGDGGPGYNMPLEDSSLPHDFGVISMARDTDPNTAGSQFFVCLSRAGTQHLDHRYASFGQLVRGKDVVLATAQVPVGKDDRPTNPPIIRRAYLVDAMPYQAQ
jgi:peptidyl-prolyl cis-trans isomerase B (cyclophilin B)